MGSSGFSVSGFDIQSLDEMKLGIYECELLGFQELQIFNGLGGGIEIGGLGFAEE